MNLGRALFLHDLISDEEIDICAHIFHLLCKTVLRTDSRACIPFCCLILRILKLKGWVKRKSFFVSPIYLAEILHINRPMLATTLVYDDLNLDKDLLQETLGRNLKFSQTGNSISVSSLSPELRVLTIIMFHNLYPLSSIG